MRARRVGRALGLVALASLLPGGEAHAYCRTSTCDDCPRDENGCTVGGTAVAWPARCVAFGIHVEASEQVDLATVEMLTDQAFATWNAIRCEPSGLAPSIELTGTDGPVVCGRSEFVGDALNANILAFRDDAWPYDGEGDDLATTTVRSRAHGEIVDADVEVNATRPLLVTDTTEGGTIVGAHDLLSILTHEFGHLLGLDHSTDPESIMQVTLPPRVVRTTLGADDVAGICAAYPPERDALPCDDTRRAFAAQCALDPSTGGACSTAGAGADASDRRASSARECFALLFTMMIGRRLRARWRSAVVVSRRRYRATRASTVDGRGAPD